MQKIQVVLLFILITGKIFSDGSQAFDLDLKKDIIIGSTSLAAFTTGYLIKDNKSINKDEFGWFDEEISYKYNTSFDDLGSVISLSSLVTMPFLIDQWNVKEVSTIGVMYLEAALLAYGVKDILKGVISRPRPYVHRNDSSSELLEERDGYFSFPSGHTSVAFMTASFSTYVFSQGDSSKTLKWTMGISTFSLATLTGILRVTSGAHYPTDVLAGAILGSGVGFAIPFMHKTLPDNINLTACGNYVGVSVRL